MDRADHIRDLDESESDRLLCGITLALVRLGAQNHKIDPTRTALTIRLARPLRRPLRSSQEVAREEGLARLP